MGSGKKKALVAIGILLACYAVFVAAGNVMIGMGLIEPGEPPEKHGVSKPAEQIEPELVSESGLSIDEDAVKRYLSTGMRHGKGTVRFNGEVTGVSSNTDGSENGLWVVVDAYSPAYGSGDDLVQENAKAAAALAVRLREYPSVSKVVWNVSAKMSSGEVKPCAQICYLTSDLPDNPTDRMIESAASYSIKDPLWAIMKNKPAAQKKD